MTSNAINRYEIPVDDQWHTLRLAGPIVHVDCRDIRTVEIWAWAGGPAPRDRVFRVYGTGHPVKVGEGESASHVGTALSPTGLGPFSQAYGQAVWHLIERHTHSEHDDGIAEWERELLEQQAKGGPA